MARSKANKASGSKVKLDKKRRLLVSFITLIAVLIAVVCGVYINGAIQDNAVQSSMKEYLQNKYGKEFTVGRPKGRRVALELRGI